MVKHWTNWLDAVTRRDMDDGCQRQCPWTLHTRDCLLSSPPLTLVVQFRIWISSENGSSFLSSSSFLLQVTNILSRILLAALVAWTSGFNFFYWTLFLELPEMHWAQTPVSYTSPCFLGKLAWKGKAGFIQKGGVVDSFFLFFFYVASAGGSMLAGYNDWLIERKWMEESNQQVHTFRSNQSVFGFIKSTRCLLLGCRTFHCSSLDFEKGENSGTFFCCLAALCHCRGNTLDSSSSCWNNETRSNVNPEKYGQGSTIFDSLIVDLRGQRDLGSNVSEPWVGRWTKVIPLPGCRVYLWPHGQSIGFDHQCNCALTPVGSECSLTWVPWVDLSSFFWCECVRASVSGGHLLKTSAGSC